MSGRPLTHEPLRIAIVGGGPRCLGLLDSIGANAEELPGDARRVRVDIFDPYPVGGGRVWRRDQPSLLWMNTPVSTVTIFPDETSTLKGPVRCGPTLYQWIISHRDELLKDDLLADEVRELDGDTFASRALQSEYLSWAFRNILGERAGGTTVVVHASTVIDVVGDAPQTVVTDTGEHIEVDRVVLAQGHLDDELDPRELAALDFAAQNGLQYLPPAYTADCDTELVPAGEPVLVNGMGLAFIDWMVLLGQTRGGHFQRAADGALKYLPSGREPIMFAGSRRGAAYYPKITSPLRAAPPALPHFFTVEAVRARFPDPGACDFRDDLWPLACKEIAYAHYAELFRAHPARTAMSWHEFLPRFAGADYGSGEMIALLAEAVPYAADRLVIADIDRPFGAVTGTASEKENAVVNLIEHHLARIQEPAASTDSAVVLAFFSVYGVLGEMVRGGALSPEAIVYGVDRWFHGLFSHVTSGPPPERLAQLAAMHRAGIVRFLGDETRMWADAESGLFAASSRSWNEPVYARTLIEARLPPADVRRTVDGLTRALVARGELTDDFGELHSGRIRVDESGRLVRADGSVHPARWSVGPWVVGSGWANAFPKPGQDAGFFRQNDSIARAVLSSVKET